MKAQPITKEILEKAKKLGVTKITLEFSGGNDEGYLTVWVDGDGDSDFESEIETWAWEVYDYSGAGDGNDYGDTIVYNLKKKTVTTSEWAHVRQDSDEESGELEIA